MGAQFYPNCLQVKVNNGGSVALPQGIPLPGSYDPQDPGILVQLYQITPQSPNYVAPGGPVLLAYVTLLTRDSLLELRVVVLQRRFWRLGKRSFRCTDHISDPHPAGSAIEVFFAARFSATFVRPSFRAALFRKYPQCTSSEWNRCGAALCSGTAYVFCRYHDTDPRYHLSAVASAGQDRKYLFYRVKVLVLMSLRS